MTDLELYRRALKLNPDLWHATQLVARVKEKALFPIETVQSLVEALADKPGGHCKLDGVVLTSEHATKYFPVRFFPVVNEEALLIALYVAFCSGRTIHSLESQLESRKNGISSTSMPAFVKGVA
jgi:hypothetical protein